MKPNPKSNSEIVLYQTADGRTRIECRFEQETVWMTQALMAELFQTTPQNITLHLRAIYAEGELTEAATCKDCLQVRSEGGRQIQRSVEFCCPDVIISAGESRTSSGLRPPSSQSGEGKFCGTLTQGRCLGTATGAPTLG